LPFYWFDEEAMHLKSAAALCFGLVIFGLAAAPANAQTRQRVARVAADGTRITTTDENGRTRTRIVVQQRSFLDGGTEVLPGQRKFTDYVNPWGSSPLASLVEGTNLGGLRYPLPYPLDLAGKDNPYLFQ
jgi:hypothetical protein